MTNSVLFDVNDISNDYLSIIIIIIIIIIINIIICYYWRVSLPVGICIVCT